MGGNPTRQAPGRLRVRLRRLATRDIPGPDPRETYPGPASWLATALWFGAVTGLIELALVLLGPIAAMVIQLAVSRQREFEADRVGAEILGRPMPLANALRRLDAMSHRIPMQIAPAVAPLAQVNPLAGQGGMTSLFSTHPPTEQRVERLEKMTGTLPGA